MNNKNFLIMITREDIQNLKQEEISVKMQQAVDEYKIGVDDVTAKEELEQMEQDLFALQDEYGKFLSEKTYNLPEFVEFEGKKYKKNEVTTKIVYFLNKMEVEWRYTLGLHQMVSILKKKDIKTIPYSGYDSILRTLNQIKFKGDVEWTDILIVNDYLAVCHEEYTRDTSYLIYLSSLHNVLLDRMKLVDPDSVADVPEMREA